MEFCGVENTTAGKVGAIVDMYRLEVERCSEWK